MTKYPLEIKENSDRRVFPWSSCATFVENSRGVLIHRPRSGNTYNIHRAPHVAVSFWCGASVSSDGKNFTFHATPPAGKIVCARCEAAAVANGMPSADDLAEHHVHVGRTVAVVTCCAGIEVKP